MLPFLKNIEKAVDKMKDKVGYRQDHWPIFVLGVVLLLMAFMFVPSAVELALSLALFLAPLWLPILLVGGAWKLWVVWRRSEYSASQTAVLLEIKPPRNLIKTPLAMETFLSGMHFTGGESTWYAVYIKGSTRPWFSLEIASFEGQVHIFIWTRAIYRRSIEAQLYAQYPGVQIVEAPDYTRLLSAKTEEWTIWGCDYAHTSKDPLPIKTYVEYGLDKVQKETEQVDPLASLIEFMGSIGKGEYLWLQIVIRTHKGEKYGNQKNAANTQYTWKDEAANLVQEIREATRMPYIDPASGKEIPGFPNPTKGQMEKIAAIERNVSKLAFDVGMRGVYLVKPEKFNVNSIWGLINLFKQFHSEGWNALKPTKWMMGFDDYPWEATFGVEKLKNKVRRGLVEAYRRRQFFYDPFSFGLFAGKTMVMSTEELATIFHIPSASVETPGLKRIQSATGEAPRNLPT